MSGRGRYGSSTAASYTDPGSPARREVKGEIKMVRDGTYGPCSLCEVEFNLPCVERNKSIDKPHFGRQRRRFRNRDYVTITKSGKMMRAVEDQTPTGTVLMEDWDLTWDKRRASQVILPHSEIFLRLKGW